jgi:hypothetical protein
MKHDLIQRLNQLLSFIWRPKKMKYIYTKPTTVHITTEQRETLEEIKRDIELEFNIKIPLTEIIRQALEKGIPLIRNDRSFIFE